MVKFTIILEEKSEITNKLEEEKQNEISSKQEANVHEHYYEGTLLAKFYNNFRRNKQQIRGRKTIGTEQQTGS